MCSVHRLNPRCPIPPAVAVHMHLKKHMHWDDNTLYYVPIHHGKGCTLTRFRCWNGCRGLFDAYDLRWPWKAAAHAALWLVFLQRRRMVFRAVCFDNCSGLVQGHVSAAAHVAASDCDRFWHVHAKHGAEGIRLRGAHAGYSPGLDTISTGCRTLKSDNMRVEQRSQCRQDYVETDADIVKT